MDGVCRDRHHARMRRQYTGEQRAKLVALVTRGHATAREAATRLGVAPSTAYYWLKRESIGKRRRPERRSGRREADQGVGTTFARLIHSVAIDAAIAVRVGSAEIQVRRGFDGAFLRDVVAALVEGTP